MTRRPKCVSDWCREDCKKRVGRMRERKMKKAKEA
jgi:hypothetical protein